MTRKDGEMSADDTLFDAGRTASAMQVPCGLVAVASKDGDIQWMAFIGPLRETAKDPRTAWRKVWHRLCVVNKALGSNFSVQMDVARAKGAREVT